MNNTSIFQAIQYRVSSNAIQYHTNTKYFTPCNSFNLLFSFKHHIGLFLTFYAIEFPLIIYSVPFWYFSLYCYLIKIWNSPYFNFLWQHIWNAHIRIACALLRQICLVLLIFHSSIAIPIPGLQCCIAIQNSKTCSSLVCTTGLGTSEK